MALTKEQIKNLKPGDPLIIHGTFEKMVEGYTRVKFPVTLYDSTDNSYTKHIHPSAVAVVEPTYDTKRLFKKRDIVRVVERDGRLPSSVGLIEPGHIYTVYADEDDGEVILDIGLGTEGGEAVEWYYLELITPVEDNLPYYIEEKDIEFQVRMRVEDEDCLISTFRFKNIVEAYRRYSTMLPSMKQAREAAEAECERLNEEYRKEQK